MEDIQADEIGLSSHTDLPRSKAGMVGGQFWSVFVECPDVGNLDDATHSVRDTIEQIDVAKRMINAYDYLHYCETSSCVMPAFKKGRLPSMLGAEGLHQVVVRVEMPLELVSSVTGFSTIIDINHGPLARF